MTVLTRRRDNPPRSMTRWEPFRELDELQRATERLLENAWTGEGQNGVTWAPPVAALLARLS